MKIAKKDATVLPQTPDWTVWDYALSNKEVGLSYQKIQGRVPEKGSGRNTVCWEAYFVISGTLVVFVDSEKFELTAGDLIEILPGKSSYLVADHAEIITITNPDWHESQFETVS